MSTSRYSIGFIAPCLLAAGLLLNGCASTKDPAEQFQGQSAQKIFEGGEQALAKGNYTTATKHYEGLDALYPFSPYSEQATLDSIYAYHQSGDQASAAATATRFIHMYPTSSHIDYAYYMKGVSEMLEDRTWPQRYLNIDIATRDPGEASKAFDTFSLLVQQYPNSPYTPDARQHMIDLRNLSAQAELEVAHYYFVRHAYVGAANRASYILTHFNGTPATEQALGIMVKAYRALGEIDEANKALQVLQFNYPNSALLKTLRTPL